MDQKTHLSLKKLGAIATSFVAILAAGFAYQQEVTPVNAQAHTRSIEDATYTVELNDQNSLKDVVASMLEYEDVMQISKLGDQIYSNQSTYLDLSNVELMVPGEQEVVAYVGVDTPAKRNTTLVLEYPGDSLMQPGIGYEKHITVDVVDTTAPVIELKNTSLTLEYGASFDAKSVVKRVSDNSTLPIEPKITSNVDTKTAGKYEVRVSATDASGNTATKSVAVQVKDKPVAPKPTITTPSVSVQNPSGVRGMFNLINAKRQSLGLRPLAWAPNNAQQATQLRAQEASRFVSHTRPDG
ncbi:MAG: immunoglobulin-like domain-containing protein, partial [Erysipelotrichaceae bacterium]